MQGVVFANTKFSEELLNKLKNDCVNGHETRQFRKIMVLTTKQSMTCATCIVGTAHGKCIFAASTTRVAAA